MKKIIKKYRKHYPTWLFLWLIKKHWLYPEPMVFMESITVTTDILMQRGGEREIARLMKEKMWNTIEEMWKKYRYVPSIPDTQFIQDQDFEQDWKILRYKIVARYAGHRNFRYMQDLIQFVAEIDNRNRFDGRWRLGISSEV